MAEERSVQDHKPGDFADTCWKRYLIQESLDRSKQGCWAGEIQAEAGVQVEAGVQAEAGVQTVAQGQGGAQVDEWAESLWVA